MSLNWKEINRILTDTSLAGMYIRQIFQRDYRNIYFHLSSAKRNCYLRICLEQGRARLHESKDRPPSKGVQPRFSEFLRSRIRGGRIESAQQCGRDRIIMINICHHDERTILYLKLWGNAANVIVCDDGQTILEAAYRRPGRGECIGRQFHLPESPPTKEADKEKEAQLAELHARPAKKGLSYSQSIAAEYREIEEADSSKRLLQELRRYYSMKENSLAARIARIEKAARGAESADIIQNQADIILAQSWKIQKNASSFIAEDYHHAGENITISLNPALSAAENAQQLYEKARKLRARAGHLGDERTNIAEGLKRTQAILHVLDDKPPLTQLRELWQAQQEESRSLKGSALKEGQPGLTYSSQGFQILVGRTAKENESLLRRFTRGNDTWLHTRDYPGAYVFIKQKPGKSIPLEVLIDAGNLALYYSKAKSNGQADLYYTQVKYLRRPRRGKAGLVLPTQEKNLFLRADEERMRRLLSGKT